MTKDEFKDPPEEKEYDPPLVPPKAHAEVVIKLEAPTRVWVPHNDV